MDILRVFIEYADQAAAAMVLPLACWILLSGIDELPTIIGYLCARFGTGLPLPKKDAVLNGVARRIAIYVPLWQEEAVIGGMLGHNLAAIGYANFDFFVGVYPNDPGTLRAVRAAAARSPRVHLALCPHDGPTSKADCINWIYQRMLLHEREHTVDFDIIMTHDAEDLIHRDELRLVNYYAAEYDMIQVPVLPLPTPVSDWIHGIYCDDFAEFHGKDLPARWWLGGFIPSSGVGTAFSRRSIEALAVAGSNVIFRPDCLTEDYEAGYRLHTLGFKQLFMPVCRSGSDQPPVATREFFPRTFRTARRQRTRWTTGIVLQGWARNGWGSSWNDAYWFWHDRKGLIGNPASLIANLIFVYGVLTGIGSLWLDRPWRFAHSISTFAISLLPLTAGFGVLLCCVRAGCAASVYGWGFAAWSPLRSLLGNLLNTMASLGALQRFIRSVVTGQPLVWLKTEHAYPNLAALESYKPTLESILLANGAVQAEALREAQITAGVASLADRLLAAGAVTEEALLGAMMARHQLQGGEVPANRVNPHLRRLIPADLALEARVSPIDLREGVLTLACADLPEEGTLARIQAQVSLAVEFHLVTPRNLLALGKFTES